MTSHVWAIDTPWTKAGDEFFDEELTLTIRDGKKSFTDHTICYGETRVKKTKNELIKAGWIKPVEEKPTYPFWCGPSAGKSIKKPCCEEAPVEEKKLTEEEILKKIGNYTEVYYKDGTKEIVGDITINVKKLAKFLAEHLK